MARLSLCLIEKRDEKRAIKMAETGKFFGIFSNPATRHAGNFAASS
jgi:hypothetical protein